MQVFSEQENGGKLFFIDGTGAWGNTTPGNVAYGASKRAITQLKVRSASSQLFVRSTQGPVSSLPAQLGSHHLFAQSDLRPVSSVSGQLNVQTTHDAASSPSSLLSVRSAIISSHLIFGGACGIAMFVVLCCTCLQELGLWHILQSVPCGQACRGQKECKIKSHPSPAQACGTTISQKSGNARDSKGIPYAQSKLPKGKHLKILLMQKTACFKSLLPRR